MCQIWCFKKVCILCWDQWWGLNYLNWDSFVYFWPMLCATHTSHPATRWQWELHTDLNSPWLPNWLPCCMSAWPFHTIIQSCTQSYTHSCAYIHSPNTITHTHAHTHTHTLDNVPVMAPTAAILDGYLETRSGQKKKNQKRWKLWLFPPPSPNFQQLFPNCQTAFTHTQTHIKTGLDSQILGVQSLIKKQDAAHKAGTHKTAVWVSVFWLRICF